MNQLTHDHSELRLPRPRRRRILTAITTALVMVAGVTAGTVAPAAASISGVSIGAQSPASVTQGNSASYTVTVTGSSGDRFRFTSITGLPAGASATIDTSTCFTVPGDGSYEYPLTVSTAASTPAGTTTFTVTTQERFNLFGTCNWPGSSDSGTRTLVVASARTLAFTAIPGPGAAGSAIPGVAVSVKNGNGTTDTAATGSVTMSIKSGAQSAFNVGSTTTVDLAAGTGTATFTNLAVSSAGTYTLTATPSITGVSAAADSSAFLVNPLAASKLAFTTAPVSGQASATANLGPITVQRQDMYNNPVTTGTTVVGLDSNSTGARIFAATSGGTTSVSSVTIAAGASSASFWYGDTRPGSPAITVSGLGSATQTEAITAASAAKLVITSGPASGAASATANAGPITVERRDAFDNPVTSGATIVSLSSNSTGTRIFAAGSGGASVPSVTIQNGNPSVSFWYGDTKPGTATLTASVSGGGIASATATATINPLPASKLVITSGPVSGAASATANVGPITVERQDIFNNPVSSGSTVVTLSSDSTGTKVFAAGAGGAPVGTVTIQNNHSSVSFWYGDTRAAAPTITVSGLGTAQQGATITAADPAKLVFGTGPSDVIAGASMSPAVTVQVQDQFGNNKAAGGTNVTLNLSSGSIASGGAVATDAGGLATFNNVTINMPALGLTMTASAGSLSNAGPSGPFTVSTPIRNGARLTDTVVENGSGVKSVAYYYCAGFTGDCTNANWTLIGSGQSGSTPVTWSNHLLPNGSYRVLALATDNLNQASSPSSPLPVTIQNTPLLVGTASLPGGEVTSAYSFTLAATGGVAPYSWAQTGGTLPAGLTLEASTGVISGTPTTAGNATNLVFRATDVNGLTSSSGVLSISVNPAEVATFFVPNASDDKVYVYGASGTPMGSWTLSAANSNPTGVAVVGSNVYVLDDGSTRRVFRYDRTGGSVSQSRALGSTSSSFPLVTVDGLAIDGDQMWVVGASSFGPRIYRYSLASAFGTGGTLLASDGVDLHSSNDNASGLAIDAAYLYVTDSADQVVYRYSRSNGTSTTSKGLYNSSGTISSSHDLSEPTGATIIGTDLWVVDSDNDRAYRYSLIGSGHLFSGNGSVSANHEFSLDAGNTAPQGL